MTKVHKYFNARHPFNFILCDIEWKIAEKPLPTHIIGRRVLVCLACDEREMLLVARDIYGKDISVKDWIRDDRDEKERSSELQPISMYQCSTNVDQ